VITNERKPKTVSPTFSRFAGAKRVPLELLAKA